MLVNKDLMAVRRMPEAMRGMLNAERQVMRQGVTVGVCLALASLILLCCAFSAFGAVADDEGVRCIIGEAGNQGFDGLVACADALQNRGHTRGVYGCGAAHVDKEPAWVWKMARRAWERAKRVDVVRGATFWGSVKVDKGWIATMERNKFVKTYEYKDHVFYRER